MEKKLKSIQCHATAKIARKKLTETVAQKGGIITIGDIRASFQAREESELQKVEAAAEKAINALQKQKDLKHKKELRKFKKFWDILKTMNQYHMK